MNFDIDNRFSKILAFIACLCIFFFLRIIFLNAVRGDEYRQIADNSIYKKIVKPAPRGEIRDRNGVLLAGNKPVFTVQISKNKALSSSEINEIALKIYNILDENNEQIIDEFPIYFTEKGLVFSYDERIKDFKISNGIPLDYDAEKSFFYIVDKTSQNTGLNIDKTDDIYSIQKILNDNGIYPPISVGEKFEFTKALEKKQWLYSYNIQDENISAENALKKIREKSDIDKSLDDVEARKILVITDSIKSKGYLQYEPVTIAKNISQKTVSIINEAIISLPGISVEVEPLRYYPQGNLASHIIGQIGKISDSDVSLLEDERYTKADFVGKSGVEKAFESRLKGNNGYEKVKTDALGNRLKNLDSLDPVPGDTLYISIDAYLQKVAEDSLKKTLNSIQTGGTFESKWGNYKISKAYPNATSGAIVVLDVKTGKVLAMASYPGYDPNIFVSGITKEQYDSLQPPNPNDPLSPKPQFNIATMTTVQPGSIFKMITGLAALEEGMDENYTVEDKGVITVGGRNFGTSMWNTYKITQGLQNMVTALKGSNNYYFYCIATGFNFATQAPIQGLENMSENQIIEMAKKFGLDKKTGIEIYEVKGSIPDKEQEYQFTKNAFRSDIINKMEDSFIDINSENKLYRQRIDEIVSWIDENPERYEIINRLKKLNVKSNQLEEIADLLKYTYFNSATWTTGDVFNISIGQGAQSYSPLQMANYVSSLSNGGYLNKVSLIEKILNQKTKEEQLYIPESTKIILKDINHLAPIKKGMLEVSLNGSAKTIFSDFPIKVASKTGTAEKEGYIPTINEEQYLLSHMADYGVDKDEVLNLANQYHEESQGKYKFHIYMREAIKKLNKEMNDDKIDRFKPYYDPFAWYVAFAPYDDPQIAVATILFQAGSGTYAALPTREVIAQYMGINDEPVILNDDTYNTGITPERKEKSEEIIYDYEIPTYQIPQIYETPTYTPPDIQQPLENMRQASPSDENMAENEVSPYNEEDVTGVQENMPDDALFFPTENTENTQQVPPSTDAPAENTQISPPDTSPNNAPIEPTPEQTAPIF